MTVAEVDAVVVGAGPNGLVAANMLAEAGWDVLVLEAAGSPGGAVRSAELTAPGYISDVCSAFYPLGAASPVLARLELDRWGLVWRHAPAPLAHVLPDGRHVLLARDVDATAASLATFAAADADAWRTEFEAWQRIKPALLGALLGPFPPVRSAAGLLRRLGAGDALRFARFGTLPVRRYAIERFAGEGARLLLAGNALHTDLGPDQSGSAIFGWLLAMLAQDVGFPVPAGGAGALAVALVRRLAAYGGQVECGRPVSRVLIAGGRAVGVADAGGNLVRARRAVLADVPAPALFGDLVGAPNLPPKFVDDLGRFQWDSGTVKVDWALSAPIPWRAPEVGRAGTVHLDCDLDGLTRFAADLACGAVPADPFLLLGQMTTADPSRSPAGTESVWAYTHIPHALATNPDPDTVTGVVKRMERVIERHAPGFADLVVGRHVLSPADLQEHNPSLVGGALNAGTAAIHQQLVFRPATGLGRADTPIDRLFLAGASAHPGGGVHGACGANAAAAALARNGWAGGGYAAAVRGAHRLLYG
jgi:phytoene dehydrogenase-like protein